MNVPLNFILGIIGQKGIRTTSFLHQKIATRYNNRPVPFILLPEQTRAAITLHTVLHTMYTRFIWLDCSVQMNEFSSSTYL